MSKKNEIYIELRFKSGRLVQGHADVDDESLDFFTELIYTKGISSITSFDLRNLWIAGKLYYAYSVDVSELESIALVLLNPPQEVDRPERVG